MRFLRPNPPVAYERPLLAFFQRLDNSGSFAEYASVPAAKTERRTVHEQD
jgi:hypothetical protein